MGFHPSKQVGCSKAVLPRARNEAMWIWATLQRHGYMQVSDGVGDVSRLQLNQRYCGEYITNHRQFRVLVLV